MNVDVSFQQGEVAITFAIKSNLGKLLLLHLKPISYASQYAAKVKTLEWAFEVPKVGNWRKVI